MQLPGQGLDPDPDERRKRPGLHPLSHLPCHRLGMTVLLVIGAMPVTVFEVDPEVLDTFPTQLLDDQRMGRVGEVGLHVHHLR